MHNRSICPPSEWIEDTTEYGDWQAPTYPQPDWDAISDPCVFESHWDEGESTWDEGQSRWDYEKLNTWDYTCYG